MNTNPKKQFHGDRLRLPKPKPKFDAASGAEMRPAWNPRLVQNLISYERGKAAMLVLGRREAKALIEYLEAAFPAEEISLHDYRYAGLRVVVVADESCLRVDTARSIFESSRHALLRKHEERPRGGVRKGLERSFFRLM